MVFSFWKIDQTLKASKINNDKNKNNMLTFYHCVILDGTKLLDLVLKLGSK